jgi:hypothetical protein
MNALETVKAAAKLTVNSRSMVRFNYGSAADGRWLNWSAVRRLTRLK